jgi:hypothetical protein
MFKSIVFGTLLLAGQIPAPAVPKAVVWEYANADIPSAGVTEFLVCLDAQPTSACARVPLSVGVPFVGDPLLKTYSWTIPAITPGAHVVAVQACTANLAMCSPGVTTKFTFVIVPNDVKNIRVQ